MSQCSSAPAASGPSGSSNLSVLPRPLVEYVIQRVAIPAACTIAYSSLNVILFRYLVQATDKNAFHIVESVQDTSDGRAAWEKLTASYAGNTEARRHDLIQQLLHISISDDTMEQYLLRVERLSAQLRAMGCAFPAPVVRVLVTDGLPPAYDMVKSVLRCQKDVSDADFNLALRSHYDSVVKAAPAASRSDPTAVAAYPASASSHIVCHACKEHGHIARYCPHRPPPPPSHARAMQVPQAWLRPHRSRMQPPWPSPQRRGRH